MNLFLFLDVFTSNCQIYFDFIRAGVFIIEFIKQKHIKADIVSIKAIFLMIYKSSYIDIY